MMGVASHAIWDLERILLAFIQPALYKNHLEPSGTKQGTH